jgi:hypothetical protein
MVREKPQGFEMAKGKKQKPLEIIASVIDDSLHDLPKEEQLARLKAANAEASRALSSCNRSPSDRTERPRRAAGLHP